MLGGISAWRDLGPTDALTASISLQFRCPPESVSHSNLRRVVIGVVDAGDNGFIEFRQPRHSLADYFEFALNRRARLNMASSFVLSKRLLPAS